MFRRDDTKLKRPGTYRDDMSLTRPFQYLDRSVDVNVRSADGLIRKQNLKFSFQARREGQGYHVPSWVDMIEKLAESGRVATHRHLEDVQFGMARETALMQTEASRFNVTDVLQQAFNQHEIKVYTMRVRVRQAPGIGSTAKRIEDFGMINHSLRKRDMPVYVHFTEHRGEVMAFLDTQDSHSRNIDADNDSVDFHFAVLAETEEKLKAEGKRFRAWEHAFAISTGKYPFVIDQPLAFLVTDPVNGVRGWSVDKMFGNFNRKLPTDMADVMMRSMPKLTGGPSDPETIASYRARFREQVKDKPVGLIENRFTQDAFYRAYRDFDDPQKKAQLVQKYSRLHGLDRLAPKAKENLARVYHVLDTLYSDFRRRDEIEYGALKAQSGKGQSGIGSILERDTGQFSNQTSMAMLRSKLIGQMSEDDLMSFLQPLLRPGMTQDSIRNYLQDITFGMNATFAPMTRRPIVQSTKKAIPGIPAENRRYNIVDALLEPLWGPDDERRGLLSFTSVGAGTPRPKWHADMDVPDSIVVHQYNIFGEMFSPYGNIPGNAGQYGTGIAPYLTAGGEVKAPLRVLSEEMQRRGSWTVEGGSRGFGEATGRMSRQALRTPYRRAEVARIIGMDETELALWLEPSMDPAGMRLKQIVFRHDMVRYRGTFDRIMAALKDVQDEIGSRVYYRTSGSAAVLSRENSIMLGNTIGLDMEGLVTDPDEWERVADMWRSKGAGIGYGAKAGVGKGQRFRKVASTHSAENPVPAWMDPGALTNAARASDQVRSLLNSTGKRARIIVGSLNVDGFDHLHPEFYGRGHKLSAERPDQYLAFVEQQFSDELYEAQRDQYEYGYGLMSREETRFHTQRTIRYNVAGEAEEVWMPHPDDLEDGLRLPDTLSRLQRVDTGLMNTKTTQTPAEHITYNGGERANMWIGYGDVMDKGSEVEMFRQILRAKGVKLTGRETREELQTILESSAVEYEIKFGEALGGRTVRGRGHVIDDVAFLNGSFSSQTRETEDISAQSKSNIRFGLMEEAERFYNEGLRQAANRRHQILARQESFLLRAMEHQRGIATEAAKHIEINAANMRVLGSLASFGRAVTKGIF